MKLKTTAFFKVRRLAAYTGRLLPERKGDTGKFLRGQFYRGDRAERELFNSCIVLKNLALIHRDLPMSTDFILEQLMESSKSLKTVYADILSAYRLGQGEEAFRILPARIPLTSAKNFSALLAGIDKINPAELTIQMNAFEQILTAERMTKGMNRAERKSLITTLAATATIFAVLLNFTVVVVFMDTLKALSQIF